MTPRLFAALIAVLCLIAMALVVMITRPAHAHDVFMNLDDPVSGASCCTGPSDPTPDCQRVPPEWVPSIIHEIDGVGWRIALTVEQARFFNKSANYPIDNVVTYDRLISGLASGWAICVFAGKISCLIGSSNT